MTMRRPVVYYTTNFNVYWIVWTVIGPPSDFCWTSFGPTKLDVHKNKNKKSTQNQISERYTVTVHELISQSHVAGGIFIEA